VKGEESSERGKRGGWFTDEGKRGNGIVHGRIHINKKWGERSTGEEGGEKAKEEDFSLVGIEKQPKNTIRWN